MEKYGHYRKMRDSYERFFSKGYITKSDFFDFGLSETIYASDKKAEEEWGKLKSRINNNKEVFIRGFGRDAKGTPLFFELYKMLLGHTNVKKDSTNNAEPTKIIRELTGYSKTVNSKYENIRNYQVSHVFGRTKNIYAFTAPWNIVYMPKILDPFTGHEAKGDLVNEYTRLFQMQSYNKFEKLIDEFNLIVTEPVFLNKIESSLIEMESSQEFDTAEIAKLREAVKNEFMPVQV